MRCYFSGGKRQLALDILTLSSLLLLSRLFGSSLVLELISHLDGKYPGVEEGFSRFDGLTGCRVVGEILDIDCEAFGVVIFPGSSHLVIEEELAPIDLDLYACHYILFADENGDFRCSGIDPSEFDFCR